MYCTYLTASNEGYMRRKSGTVSLANIGKYVGKENMWNIETCGKRSIPTLPKPKKYKPTQSTLDFPYVNDDVGPKDVTPKGLQLSKDVNKKWAGRGAWMR